MLQAALKLRREHKQNALTFDRAEAIGVTKGELQTTLTVAVNIAKKEMLEALALQFDILKQQKIINASVSPERVVTRLEEQVRKQIILDVNANAEIREEKNRRFWKEHVIPLLMQLGWFVTIELAFGTASLLSLGTFIHVSLDDGYMPLVYVLGLIYVKFMFDRYTLLMEKTRIVFEFQITQQT